MGAKIKGGKELRKGRYFKKGIQVLLGIQSASVDVYWRVSVTKKPTRDILRDLPGSPSLQEDTPSLKRGFLALQETVLLVFDAASCSR